jgi:hypothetical protein
VSDPCLRQRLLNGGYILIASFTQTIRIGGEIMGLDRNWEYGRNRQQHHIEYIYGETKEEKRIARQTRYADNNHKQEKRRPAGSPSGDPPIYS